MRSLKILHIEDCEEDALLFGKACEIAGLRMDCCVVRDGSEAVEYLKGAGDCVDGAKNLLPDVIVLDLNMPHMSGFEFLKWLRRQAQFEALPVLVFTVSERMEDKERAIAEGATGYFVKPLDFESLVRMAESLRCFGGRNGENKK